VSEPKIGLRTRWRRRRATDVPNAEGSPLVGYVEFPADGADVDRRLTVSGWHAWHAAPVAAVVVETDDLVQRAQVSTTPRDDVAADRDDDRFLGTGWVAELELGAVRTPTVTLRITVFPAADHHRGVALEPITVSVLGDPTINEDGTPIPPPNWVQGRLDVPGPGARVPRGAVTVRGWATTRDAPVRSVELWLNDVALGRARLGLDREDVASGQEWTDAPICGFEQTVDLSGVGAPDGPATFRASVVALDGTTGALEHDVVLGARDPAPAPPPTPSRREPPARDAGLHLLVFTHDLGLGGAQLWLVEALRKSRAGSAYPCTVVAFGGGALCDELRAMGVEVHVTSSPPVHDVVAYEGRLEELVSWFGERGCTAALVNTFRAFAGADLAERLGLPVVWAVHESWPASLVWSFDHPGTRIDRAIRSYAESSLARAGSVVFESEATRALYAPRAPGRTLVVPYGVDTAELDRFAASTSRNEARRRLGLGDDGRVLLVMGTVEPRKGQSLLVEAFAEVAARHDDVSIALVGDLHTDYSRAISEFAARANLADRVRLEGVTPDANLWYRAGDALVCGSDVESLPRSVLDAMCLGLPVLSTNVFGLAELLDDGVTGLLYEPLDLGAAIDALDRLLSMPPDELAGIAARGAALVHRDHDSAGYAGDVLALLKGLIADPTATPVELLAKAGRRTAQSSRA
jgi:D-inositol-3-phosphate glycosyltransferase